MSRPGEERKEEHGGEAEAEEGLGEEEAVVVSIEVETTGTKLRGLVVAAGNVGTIVAAVQGEIRVRVGYK